MEEGETPVTPTVPEESTHSGWAVWDEWAALQEEEDRLHNYRPPGETSSESGEASNQGGVSAGRPIDAEDSMQSSTPRRGHRRKLLQELRQ